MQPREAFQDAPWVSLSYIVSLVSKDVDFMHTHVVATDAI